MTKKALATVLILLVVLPALVSAGSVLFAPRSSFALFDEGWENSISAALGEDGARKEQSALPLPENGRYIVKFKNDAALEVISEALENISYRQLAESEYRLFAISDENGDFLKKHQSIIDYSEPDLVRGTMAVTNDPAVSPVYEQIGITSAWDTVRGSNEVIVAVLDTGVDRTHEDLVDVNILPGYDAVTKTAGVYEDGAGHGTGVIGIIAAAADNGLGIAGVAHGVSVLPVKVSASSTTIYSSDLISGIRFAANAGAKIINMSVGGYSSSYAEQEAVNYAISRGCILISASGNEGNLPYAGEKSYPASYDGVISVASCTPDGKRSEFSQYNDMVDVAAPGEMIPIPYTENGVSVYRNDSGTSYSCAFVSGIAALAASHIDSGVRFDGDEFLALIIDTCGISRSDEFGHGIINARAITERVNLPIVTGVSDGGVYYESLTVGFNRGMAYLDSEPFEDGDSIIANGRHSFTVIDGENERRISFRLEYDPLSYEFKEFASFAYFEFERGTALLDGFPYKSGERITASGKHSFFLTDGDESLEKEIDLQYTLPTVYGIEDGGIYTEPVSIRIIGDGSAELDGNAVYGEAAVAESGVHTLTVRSGNGAVSEEYTFEIDFPYGEFHRIDYAGGKAAMDSENGYFCLYGESLAGVRIYDINSPENHLYFLPAGRIYSHAFNGGELILMGDDGVTVVNRANALDPETAVTKSIYHENMSLYTFAEGEIYCFDSESLYRLDPETDEPIFISDIGFECEAALYSQGLICMLAPSSDRLVRTYDIETGDYFTFAVDAEFDADSVCFGEGYIAVGNSLIDVRNGNTVLEYCSYAAIDIANGLLFAENVVIDIATGEEIGMFPFLVSDIVFENSSVFIFGDEPIMAKISGEAEGVAAYGAARRTYHAFSAPEASSPYRTNLYYDKFTAPVSAAANADTLFALFDGRNSLFALNLTDNTEYSPVALKFRPEQVSVSGGYVTVVFANMSCVYVAPAGDIANGVYIELPAKCLSACVANGRLYAVSGGRLVHCAVDGSGTAVTSVRAQKVAAYGDERIYVLNEGVLSAYDTRLTRIAYTNTEGDGLFVSTVVVAGGVIYDPMLTVSLGTVPKETVAVCGNAYINGTEIYELFSSRYIGNTGISSPAATVIGEGGRVIALGNSIAAIHGIGEENIADLPVVSGISDGSIYSGSAVVEFSRGFGYIDGEPVESGYEVNDAGSHTFILSLPFGEYIRIDFTVEAEIESIEFLSPNRTMSVGETITLLVRYLPDGASSVPVTFSCDSDGILPGEMGEITALEVGTYTVTATAVTDYGTFTAQNTVTVRDDLISFIPESGIRIDRDNGMAIGIAPDTDAAELKDLIYAQKEISVIDSAGKETDGVIATGYRLVLFDGNNVTDELTAVIIGDTDGDGFITPYDMYILERILRNQKFSPAFIRAADIDGNGILADNDYRALRNIVLRRTDSPVGTPQNNLFGLSSVQTVSRIESGDIIDVAVCISGCKYARGISGVLNYSEGLEFIEGAVTGWDGAARDIGGNRVSFYTYGDSGEECGKAFMVLINLRFRVTARAGTTVSLTSDGLTAAFETGARVIRFENSELFVYEQTIGELNITFSNAYSFEFDPAIHSYTAVIPYNSALADISVTRNIGQGVTVSGLVIPDSGNGTVTVSINELDGSASIYTIQVHRDSEPRFDTNCKLAVLEIEGYPLTPQFDPDITEYSISVPHGTEKINMYCVAQSSMAQVVIGDTVLRGELTPITVTVSSPDGESLIYTVNVRVLSPETESSQVTLPPDGDDEAPSLFVIIVIIAAVVGAAAIIVLYLKMAKRDEEIKNSQAEQEQ